MQLGISKQRLGHNYTNFLSNLGERGVGSVNQKKYPPDSRSNEHNIYFFDRMSTDYPFNPNDISPTVTNIRPEINRPLPKNVPVLKRSQQKLPRHCFAFWHGAREDLFGPSASCPLVTSLEVIGLSRILN